MNNSHYQLLIRVITSKNRTHLCCQCITNSCFNSFGNVPSINHPPSEDMYALVIMKSRSVRICTTSSRIPGLLTLSICVLFLDKNMNPLDMALLISILMIVSRTTEKMIWYWSSWGSLALCIACNYFSLWTFRSKEIFYWTSIYLISFQFKLAFILCMNFKIKSRRGKKYC